MNEKTVSQLIEALEEIEGEYGNLPVAVCSVGHEFIIVALVVTPDGKRAELQIART